MAASTYNQIHYKNDDYEHETVVKRVPSYDEDIVNQLETFGYATRTECINASYKCVDYKNPNEVIQRIDDEQSNSIHAYEHDCISITSNINNSNINNIIKPSPSPPPGPPPPLYRNKRHMLQFPQTQNDIYPCPNIIIQEWTEESQPPSPTNASPVPDFTEDDEIDTYQQILVKKNTGSRSKLMPIALEIPPFLQLMKTYSLSNDIEEDDAKDIDNTDRVQLYQVIRDITDMKNHDDTAKAVLLLTHPLVTKSHIILKCLEQRMYRDDHDINCRMSTTSNGSGHRSSPSITSTNTCTTTTNATHVSFPSIHSFSNLSEIASSSLRDRSYSNIGTNTPILSTFSIQSKVIEFIRFWMMEYWDEDWAENSKLRIYCKTFIKRYRLNEKVNLYANEINKGMYLIDLLETTMKQCMKNIQSQKLSNIFGDKIGCDELLSPRKKKSMPPQHPMLTLKSTSSNKSMRNISSRGGSKYSNEISKDIVDIDSKLVAEQLTLMQYKLYQNIHPRECLNQAWKDCDKKYIIAPNISAYIDQFNKITKWIQLSILSATNIKHRGMTIKRWIKIEECLLKCNNLMGVAAIRCALNSNAIFKLKYAWNFVEKKHSKHMKEHKEIADKYDRSNWKSLRLYENECKEALIPYFPMFATDMIGIELTNKKRVKNGTINFKALCNIYDRIVSHLIHQKKEYNNIKLDATIQRYISNEISKYDILNEDEIFEKSNIIINKDKQETDGTSVGLYSMYQKIRLNPSMTVKASLKSQRKSQHTENNSKTSAFSDNCDQMKNENITETDYVSVKYYQQDEVNNTNSKTDDEKQDLQSQNEASNNKSSELPESIQSSHNSSSFSYNVSVLKTDKEDRISSESQQDSDVSNVSNVSPIDTGFHVNEMMFVEKNVVTNACDSYAKILHILRDWESNIDNIQSFSTNILTFPKDPKHQSTPQLYGNENGNDNDDNNEQGNNNQQHENNRKNNGKHNKQNKDRKDDNNEDRNEKKDNNAKKNYDCNIQWHATIIRCLEHKVHDQTEEIKALKRQLCQQTNCNTLMKIDIALAKYYKQFGVNYLFIQGNGLLSQFVLKNNLNDRNSLLINILSSKFNSQNSIYTRFDEAFPFPNFINVEQLTNKQKEEIIFSIIQYCFRHNEPPSFDEIQNKWDEIQYKQQKCILNKQECKRQDKKDNVIYSRRLIREVIPKHIAENIVNISDYMKKHILIYGDTALIETTDRKHAIIDYNFHCKRTKQSVYVVADKIRDKVAGNVWKLRHDLSYGFQVEKKFDVSISALKLEPIGNIKIKFMDKIQKIKQMLQIKNVRDNITQCKYVKWEKVQIHARKSTSPLSLTLTNTDFVRRLQKFVNNTNNINLLPIAIFNENKYCIHIIWLVDIGYGTIGIALKINKSKLIVCGIYLDIHDAHLLVPKHKCNCLPFSHCKIDDLTIGTKINGEQMVRQNKSLKIQINDANKSIKKLQRLCEIDSVCLTKIKDVLKQGDIQQLLISLLEKQDELKQQYGIYQEKQYELQQQQDEHQKIINSLIVKMNSMPTSPNQLMLQSVLH